MINAVICGIIPNKNDGASASVYFNYIEKILKISEDFDLFIINNKLIDYDNKIEKLIEQLNHPINLKIHNFKLNTSINYIPWSKNFYLFKYFSKKIILEKPYDNLIFLDLEVGFLNIASVAVKKILWLGDLTFELEWYNYIENNNKSLPKFLSTLYYFINKIAPYKLLNSKFDKIVCCSFSAQIRLNRLGIKGKFLPFPYPSMNIADNRISNFNSEKKFLFYGNLVGSGSTSGLNFLFREILPNARKIWGKNNFSIVIGGRTKLPDLYEDYLNYYTEVSYIGYISDLGSTLKQFSALLIPISLPVGNRTRVLDGLSFGIPVVGHTALSYGNPFLINEVNCLLADTGLDFINKLNRICDDKKLYMNIIQNGIKTYDITYNPILDHAKQLLN